MRTVDPYWTGNVNYQRATLLDLGVELWASYYGWRVQRIGQGLHAAVLGHADCVESAKAAAEAFVNSQLSSLKSHSYA